LATSTSAGFLTDTDWLLSAGIEELTASSGFHIRRRNDLFPTMVEQLGKRRDHGKPFIVACLGVPMNAYLPARLS
jgi:hypothetical protein